MSFWENLSPAVKRYAIFGAVMLAALLVFRQCTSGPSTANTTTTRGIQK